MLRLSRKTNRVWQPALGCLLLALAPFGCGNPPPLFAALNAEVAGPPAVRAV